jgi:hypothetical protein
MRPDGARPLTSLTPLSIIAEPGDSVVIAFPETGAAMTVSWVVEHTLPARPRRLETAARFVRVGVV